MYSTACMYIHVLMRDEKEGRKKQARSNKYKAKQHSIPKTVTFPIHVLMRDEKEGRKKQAWSNKQQGKYVRACMYVHACVCVCVCVCIKRMQCLPC